MSAVQREDGIGGIDLNTPVRAVNHSDVTVTWKYARVKHVLQPGQQTFVPYMAMVYWQGDPRAIDLPGNKPHEQYRRNELERLRVLHGVYEHEERWAQLPKIECFPIDSDVPFATVLADPEGISLSEQKSTNVELATMREMLEQQAAQMRAMQAQIVMREQQEASVAAAGMDPTDLDRQATTSRSITPEEATGMPMVGAKPVRNKSMAAKKRPSAGEGPQVTKDGE